MRVIILLLLFVIIILIIYTNQLKDGIREAEKIIGINNLKYKLESVSYTHLDVYKRQIRFCGRPPAQTGKPRAATEDRGGGPQSLGGEQGLATTALPSACLLYTSRCV